MELPTLPSRRLVRRAYILLGLSLVGVLAACSSGKPHAASRRAFNPLSSTTTSTADPDALHLPDGFQQPDTRFVSIDPLTGKAQPTPPIPVKGGRTTVSGTVTSPGGAVPGATVHIERWVGSASGAIDVSTDGAGHFTAGGLLGGHYELRAWRAPDLATTQAATGYVADGGVFDTTIDTQQFGSVSVQLAASTGAIETGTPFTLFVLVSKEQVDDQGIVRNAPQTGEDVTLAVDAGMDLSGQADAKTGGDGMARYTLTCTQPGTHAVTATTADGVGSTQLPPCTTSTATTSTTEQGPTVIDLAIGDTFEVPDPGVYPAGAYQTTKPGCSTTWQAWVDGAWQDGTSDGFFMTLPGPGRNFEPAQGTHGCTYQRIS